MNKINFKCTPGHILIDPSQKVEKSRLVAVQDNVDDPHQGIVLAVGDTKKTDYNALIESPVRVGDKVLYSIAGIEKTRLPYENDPRHQFVVAPFSRILGVIT